MNGGLVTKLRPSNALKAVLVFQITLCVDANYIKKCMFTNDMYTRVTTRHRRTRPASMERHLRELQVNGHTLVHDAIPAPLLARLQQGFADRVSAVQRQPRSHWLQHSDPARRGQNPKGIVDLVRVCEEHPDFEALLDLPPAFEIAQAAMAQGRTDPVADEIRLFTGPILHHLPPHTPLEQQSWHNDGDYLRLTFVLSDIAPCGGGTGFLPASHQQGVAGTAFGDLLSGPVALPPTQLVAPAGSCWINWTALWHSRMANTSDVAREVVWQVYRRAHQPTSTRREGLLSEKYVKEGLSGGRGWSAARRRLVAQGAWIPGWVEGNTGAGGQPRSRGEQDRLDAMYSRIARGAPAL